METLGANQGGLAPSPIRERERLEVDVAVTPIPQSDVAATTIRERERLEVTSRMRPSLKTSRPGLFNHPLLLRAGH